MKLEYTKYGDYYLLNITIPEESKETKGKHFGKYGLLRLNFLKEHKQVLYQELLLNNKLHEHLVIIDEESNTKVNNLIKQFAEQENINEELKANNQLEWVQKMNNIKNRAEGAPRAYIQIA
ncbi:MAG: TnpV protein [Clostridia bacterium]|nr:TnpV protein [Clostridia bacterium]